MFFLEARQFLQFLDAETLQAPSPCRPPRIQRPYSFGTSLMSSAHLVSPLTDNHAAARTWLAGVALRVVREALSTTKAALHG